jgi:AraC-like DNA-binding protein
MTPDVLSEVLSGVRFTGSMFFDVTAAAPWVAEAPPSAQIADAVMAGAHHAMEYHVVARGSCWISIVDGAPFESVLLQEGDIAIIPHGEAHAMSSAPGLRTEPNVAIHRRPIAGPGLPFKLTKGHGDGETRLLCGFFTWDACPFRPLMQSLPRFMRIGRDVSPTARGLLDKFIVLASDETQSRRAGTQNVLNRLSELMLIEAIRNYTDQLGAENTSWLFGLRDPLVGRAISLLHAQPARAWTLDELAGQVGASRSALAGRFTQVTGRPPMHYLAEWRMQLAAKSLGERGAKVAAIAREVGYDSEAAFSRAFKKFSGKPPSRWRM